MTTSTINYSWPTPDPVGLQQAEIGRIKQAIEAIDVSLKGEMDGLGSASSRDVQVNAQDTTAGRLMAVGAFGIGDQILSSVTGLNSYQTAGHFITPAGGLTSLPPGWAQGRHVVSVSGGSSFAIQTITGVSANAGKSATRTWDGANWSGWKEAVFMPDMNAAIAVAIAGLVDSSPGTLDTLKELATALGNDPNFATSMATELGKKLNATAYTAADVLAKLLTVDGPGSGLDADRFDGQDSAFFLNASNLNAGTLADARLPGTMSGKAFTGAVALPWMTVKSDSNRIIEFRNAADVTRGMVRHDQANDSMVISMFNASGGWYRDLVIGGSSGVMSYGGSLQLGSATYQTDGNIQFAGGMTSVGPSLHQALGARITTDGRAYPRTAGGGDLNMNWSGQGGQPSWLWGGNDGVNMYVYNPSNFNVNYANSANYANTAGSANTLSGVGIGGITQLYTGSNQDEVNFPVGHSVLCYSNGARDRNQGYATYLSTAAYQYTLDLGASTQLGGTYRARGQVSYSSGHSMTQMQRSA